MSDRKSLANLQIKSDLFKDIKYYGSGIIDKEVSDDSRSAAMAVFDSSLLPPFRFNIFWSEAARRAARSCSRT